MDVKKIKKISIENKIPILRDKSTDFIAKILIEKNIVSILEIGSGMGYSSVFFLSRKPDLKIVSIEKDKDRWNFCSENIKNKNITFINECAFSFLTNQKYDCIFLDGPKSKQKELFEKYSEFLNEDGYIIIDNIFLKFIKQTRNSKLLLKKSEDFKLYLNELTQWEVSIIDIEDSTFKHSLAQGFNQVHIPSIQLGSNNILQERLLITPPCQILYHRFQFNSQKQSNYHGIHIILLIGRIHL